MLELQKCQTLFTCKLGKTSFNNYTEASYTSKRVIHWQHDAKCTKCTSWIQFVVMCNFASPKINYFMWRLHGKTNSSRQSYLNVTSPGQTNSVSDLPAITLSFLLHEKKLPCPVAYRMWINFKSVHSLSCFTISIQKAC